MAGQYLMDIASGLRYLHLHHIAHRDLKPDNVLLGQNGHCKIADFGVAHHFEEEATSPCSLRSLERSHSRAQIGETQGTYCFWAPEMLEANKKFNAYACDLWATGVCEARGRDGRSIAYCALISRGVGRLSRQSDAFEFATTRRDLRPSAGYYIFVTGELPFYSEAVTDLFEIIAEAKTSIPDTLSDHSTRIISGLLKVDVDTRLTVGDLEA